jgi:S1-C subfamily serine protease
VVEDIDDNYKKGFECKIYVTRNKYLGKKDKRVKAEVLAADEHRDIAVLKVAGDFGVSTELELKPFAGEPVWAVGYPVQLAASWKKMLSITSGELATVKVPASLNTRRHGYYHRVTAQVYFGSSGGGIWNREGRLVGIVVALYTAGDGGAPYEGYYYVKPTDEFVRLLRAKWKYEEVFGR